LKSGPLICKSSALTTRPHSLYSVPEGCLVSSGFSCKYYLYATHKSCSQLAFSKETTPCELLKVICSLRVLLFSALTRWSKIYFFQGEQLSLPTSPFKLIMQLNVKDACSQISLTPENLVHSYDMNLSQ